MTKFEIELHDDVLAIVDKIKNIDDHGIELVVPEGAVLFDNILNLKLLEKEADKMNKTLHFQTDDIYGQNLISTLKEEDLQEDFVSQEIPVKDIEEQKEKEKQSQEKKPWKRAKHKGDKSFVAVSSTIKSRKSKFLKIFIVLLLLAGLGGYGVVQALWIVPKADVKVVVNSQPLTKSVQIKVVKDGQNNADEKTLKGYSLETVVRNSDRGPATGEKIVGEKAEGKITITNKTTDEKKFKKGQIIKYVEGNDDLEYALKDDVTVPASTEEETTNEEGDTIKITTYGEKDTDVEAVGIGESYNISEGKNLRVDGQNKDDFTAKASVDFKGGKSSTITVVTEEDKTALIEAMKEKNIEGVEEGLKNRGTTDKVYIKGSYQTAVTKEEFDKEVGDEAEELQITQELTATGLAYSKDDLEKLLNKLVEELIPQGYTLSSQDKEINVEVLGNSDSTVANPDEADLQVTIKAYVVTIVEQEELRKELVNKSLPEAQRILGSIKNIQTYELNVSPNIPFLQKMPRNINNINVTIQRR